MSKELDREAFSDFVRALAFASRKHSQQRRKDVDASPYINHPWVPNSQHSLPAQLSWQAIGD
jgi:hypothetical protein